MGGPRFDSEPLPRPLSVTLAMAPLEGIALLDVPRQKAFKAVFGTEFGKDVAEDFFGVENELAAGIMGFGMELLGDPLNLLGTGYAKNILRGTSKVKRGHDLLEVTRTFGKADNAKRIRFIGDNLDEMLENLDHLGGRPANAVDDLNEIRIYEPVKVDTSDIRKAQEFHAVEKMQSARNGNIEDLAETIQKLDDILDKYGLSRNDVQKFTEEGGGVSLVDKALDKIGLRTNFVQRAANPAVRAVQMERNITRTGVENEVMQAFRRENAVVQQVSKDYNMPIEDVKAILTDAIELKPKGTEARVRQYRNLRRKRIETLVDQNPQETMEVLRKTGRKDELHIAENYLRGLIDDGVDADIAEFYADSFIQSKGARKMQIARIHKDLKKADKLADQANELNKRLAITKGYKELQESAERIRGEYATWLKDEIASNMGIEGLSSKNYNYMAHRLTPEASQLMSSVEPVKRRRLGFALNAELTESRRRKLNKSVAEANDWFRAKLKDAEVEFDPKIKLFTDDPLEAMVGRGLNSARGRANADAASNMVTLFAKADGKGTSIADFLTLSKMKKYHHAPTNQTIEWASKADLEKKLDDLGIADYSIPDEFINDAKLFTELSRPSGQTQKWIRRYDEFMGMMRSWVTVPFPAYHTRNHFGNFVNGGILGGTASDLGAWKMGHAVSAGVNFNKMMNPEMSKLADKMLELGVIGNTLTYDLRNLAAGMPYRSWMQKTQRLLGPFHKIGNFVEDSGRAAVFIARKNKGDTDREALAFVNKYLFDYKSGLTDFERAVPRRLGYFYTWTRFNIPLQLEQFFTPSQLYKVAAVGKAPQVLPNNYSFAQRFEETKDKRPLHLNQLDSITAPWDPDVILNLMSPVSDLTAGRFAGISSADNLIRRGLNELSPVFKLPIEVATGTSLFTGGDVSDRSHTMGRLIANAFGSDSTIARKLGVKLRDDGVYRVNKNLASLVRNMPFSRFISIADKLADPGLGDRDKLLTFAEVFFVGSPSNIEAAENQEKVSRILRRLEEMKSEGRIGTRITPTPEDRRTKSTLDRSLRKARENRDRGLGLR